MKLFLDFDPCKECRNMMSEIISENFTFGEGKSKEEISAKFLRHLTYNHNEVVQAVMKDLPKQKRNQEYDWFR